jgi:hypothetical protein
MDRAFCKDFVTKLNYRDFLYPEYPLHLAEMAALKLPNVWDTWIEDRSADISDMFDIEQRRADFGARRLQ